MSMCTEEAIKNLPANKLVQLYLMASFLYYEHNISPLKDSDYDEVCKQLLLKYKDIDHIHSHLIDKDALRAGTAYQINHMDYPTVVKIAAFSWHKKGSPITYGFVSRRRRVRNV